MKYAKRLLMVPAALAGLVLAMSLPLHAQTHALRVNIPFEFEAGNRTLPAGTYRMVKAMQPRFLPTRFRTRPTGQETLLSSIATGRSAS
jgi:hypothetical protein